MRRISDAMYYTVIKNTDIGSESLEDSMNLLYEANKDKLVSVACYTNDGKLTEASPIATENWKTFISPHPMCRISLMIHLTDTTGWFP